MRPQNGQLPFTKGIEPWDLGKTGFQTQQGEQNLYPVYVKHDLAKTKKKVTRRCKGQWQPLQEQKEGKTGR